MVVERITRYCCVYIFFLLLYSQLFRLSFLNIFHHHHLRIDVCWCAVHCFLSLSYIRAHCILSTYSFPSEAVSVWHMFRRFLSLSLLPLCSKIFFILLLAELFYFQLMCLPFQWLHVWESFRSIAWLWVVKKYNRQVHCFSSSTCMWGRQQFSPIWASIVFLSVDWSTERKKKVFRFVNEREQGMIFLLAWERKKGNFYECDCVGIVCCSSCSWSEYNGWMGRKMLFFYVHTYENFLGEPLLFRYISICVRLQSSTEMENERPEKNK